MNSIRGTCSETLQGAVACRGAATTSRSAFSLIESVVAIGLLTMMVGAITLPFSAAFQAERDTALRSQGVVMGQELMEWIIALPMADPDGLDEMPGVPRSQRDNVDDFHGYTDTVYAAPVSANVENAGDEPFDRAVAVESIYLPGQDTGEPSTVRRITVTVSRGGRELISLVRLKHDREAGA